MLYSGDIRIDDEAKVYIGKLLQKILKPTSDWLGLIIITNPNQCSPEIYPSACQQFLLGCSELFIGQHA